MANRLTTHIFLVVSIFIGLLLMVGSSVLAQITLPLPTVSLPPLPIDSVPPLLPDDPTPAPTSAPTPTPAPTTAVKNTSTPVPSTQTRSTNPPTSNTTSRTSTPVSSTNSSQLSPSGSTTTGSTNPTTSLSETPVITPTITPIPTRQFGILSTDFSNIDWYIWGTVLVALLLILLVIGMYFFRRYQASRQVQEAVPKMVHELRTPLTAIKGYLAMMLRGNYGSLSPAQKGPLVTAMSSTQRLSSMVNDLLDESSLEAGKIKLRISDFALDGVVQEVLASLQPLAQEKNLKLTSTNSDSAIVLADRDRVRQILTNLIGNSIKFTDKGSIHVSSAVAEQLINVFVTNTGPAMTEEQQHQLFKKFEQLGTKASGTGLGLYVSRELAQAMGGELWLEKSEPAGTTFAFSLPLANLTPLNKS